MFYIKIENLTSTIKNYDWFSSNDFFIILESPDESRRTTTKWNSDNPTWNEEFIFSNVPETITLKLYENNKFTAPKILQTTTFETYNGAIETFQKDIFRIHMGNPMAELESELYSLKKDIEKNKSNVNLLESIKELLF